LFLTTLLLTTSPALGAANATDSNVVEIWKLGGDGGSDYLTVDSDKHRMFIARATRVMVVDTDCGK
jgi:hypothetical protein